MHSINQSTLNIQTNNYSLTVLEDLTSTEKDELIAKKVYVETAVSNVDTFIDNEIKAKTDDQNKAKEPSASGSRKEEPIVGSSHKHKENTNQLEELRKQISELQRQQQIDRATAAETIKSLEGKLRKSFHDDLDSSEELFEEDDQRSNAAQTHRPYQYFKTI